MTKFSQNKFVATLLTYILSEYIRDHALCCGEKPLVLVLRNIWDIYIVSWSRAVDPDPHGSAFIFPPESGFRRGKFEGKNRRNARKMEENCNFKIKQKTKLPKCGQTPLFIPLEQYFLSISTLQKVICYKFYWLDPDPRFLSCWIRLRNEKNSWIRICKKWMLTHSPGLISVWWKA